MRTEFQQITQIQSIRTENKTFENIPTKLIFGAATTFFATGAAGTTEVLTTPGLAATTVAVLVLTTVVAKVVLDTTVGSDDGIGFPSFVCSFNTCNKYGRFRKTHSRTNFRRCCRFDEAVFCTEKHHASSATEGSPSDAWRPECARHRRLRQCRTRHTAHSAAGSGHAPSSAQRPALQPPPSSCASDPPSAPGTSVQNIKLVLNQQRNVTETFLSTDQRTTGRTGVRSDHRSGDHKQTRTRSVVVRQLCDAFHSVTSNYKTRTHVLKGVLKTSEPCERGGRLRNLRGIPLQDPEFSLFEVRQNLNPR